LSLDDELLGKRVALGVEEEDRKNFTHKTQDNFTSNFIHFQKNQSLLQWASKAFNSLTKLAFEI